MNIKIKILSKQSVIFIFSIIFCSTIFADSNFKLHWSAYAQMPAPRSNVALIKSQQKIYVLGGNDAIGATKTFWAFTPKTKSWQTLPSMLIPRFAHVAILKNKQLVVFGGMQAEKKQMHYLRSIEAYNFQTHAWKTVGKMPIPNARFGLANFNNKIFMIGGVNNNHPALNTVWTYDSAHNKWQRKANLPLSLSRVTAIKFQHNLYVIGGAKQNEQASNIMLQYLPQQDRWIKVATLNIPRKNFATSILHNHLIITGGWHKINNKVVFIKQTEVYFPQQKTWQIITNLPEGKDGVRMVTLNNKIYLFGGYAGTPSTEVLQGELNNSLKNNIQMVNHVCIVVSQMQQSLRFYHDLLGFKIIKDTTEGNQTIATELGLQQVKLRNVILLTPNHFELQLIQFYQPKSQKLATHKMNTIAYNHIGIGVKDINTAYQALKQHHIKTIAAPIIKKSSGYAIFFARDPDGNPIEFFQKL